MTPDTSTDSRRAALEAWLRQVLGAAPGRIAPASADASFRRYFRVWHGGRSTIAMDAPPPREDIRPYIRVAAILAEAGANVPRVLAQDPLQGFLLLTDLGERPYLDAIRAGGDEQRLYADAIDTLVRIQARGRVELLPPYDETRLRREMELFPQWFVSRHLGLEITPAERAMIDECFGLLAAEALRQPAVLVHRDYHSRNLMVCDDGNPGVLDFQDAVVGAVTYDPVSLLKDCYVRWPRQRMLGWLDLYRRRAIEAGVEIDADRRRFVRAFDLMGLQRHIKVLGIFSRLWYRDGKAGYLRDLPRVLEYALEAAAGEPALAAFDRFLRGRVRPAFGEAQARALAAA